MDKFQEHSSVRDRNRSGRSVPEEIDAGQPGSGDAEGVPRAETISLDTPTFLFTLLIAVFAALVFGTLLNEPFGNGCWSACASPVSLTDGLPLSPLSGSLGFFSVEGQPVWQPDEAPGHRTRVYSISEDFFRVLNVPMIKARQLDSGDAGFDSPVVAINEA